MCGAGVCDGGTGGGRGEGIVRVLVGKGGFVRGPVLRGRSMWVLFLGGGVLSG